MRWTVLLAAGLLAGCAAPPARWTKAEASDADFRAAIARCHNQASRMPLTPRLPSAAGTAGLDPSQPAVSLQDMAVYRQSVNACMAAEGWTRR